ncbi:MAG TPA: GNAT family N-acetyltransferase [Nannocystis sp.]|jgi:GNAT superfamily N-acetyltransferase
MSLAPFRVISVREAGVALTALQPLAEAVFGAQGRSPGWFARKLAREAIDPGRSFLALGPGDVRIGYLLISDDPLDRVAHSAGLGVLAEHRRRGVGSALIDRASAELVGAAPALQFLAEPPLRGFYERLGFTAQRTCHTLRSTGTGAVGLDLREHPPAAWTLPGHAVAGWRPGTWSRTPSADAATVSLLDGGAWAHLSREGRAIVVQRLCVAGDPATTLVADTHAALDELRGRLSRGTALLVVGCEAVSCVTASLLRHEHWQVAQTAVEMRRVIGEGVDKHAGPAA